MIDYLKIAKLFKISSVEVFKIQIKLVRIKQPFSICTDLLIVKKEEYLNKT